MQYLFLPHCGNCTSQEVWSPEWGFYFITNTNMAQRRMFSLKVVDTDDFLDMPPTTQNLYFHLAMRADDDGFMNSPKKIMKIVNSPEDDLKILITKQFILPFQSGVIVIRHWKENNYIQADRYHETIYKEEKSLLDCVNDKYVIKSEKKYIEDRKDAYSGSELPYSFSYKIRKIFYGRKCPVCNFEMLNTGGSITRKPTIQHCIPISKGGEHKLGNIAVICHNCNVSLRDTETGALNSDEVVSEWENVSILDTEFNTNVSPGKVRLELGKVRKGKDSLTSELSSQVKEIMTLFYEGVNPTINWGNKTTLKACKDLIDRFGFEEVKRMSQAVISCQGKPYAPVATTPYQMKEKLAQFKIYFEGKNSKPVITEI